MDILDELKLLADHIDNENDGKPDELSLLLVRTVGEIRKLRADLAASQAECERLRADPAPHAGIIRELLNIARLAWLAVDDSEEIETADGRGHVIGDIDFDALTQALDELDELPDDQPGVTMNAPMKAAWALRSMLADAQKGGV
jgi:hypothetical protein